MVIIAINNIKKQAYQNQNFNMHLTLSNEREYVNAVAVMESL